ITGFTHTGEKTITFDWKKPYGDWQDLFDRVYPSAALAGASFDTAWTSCICGSDGKPVSDGPYYLAAYTKGKRSTLAANPFWHGSKPAIKRVTFTVLANRNAEISVMRRHTVDRIGPTFGADLRPPKNVAGI